MARTAFDITYGFEALWPEGGPRIYFDPASLNAAQILSGLPVERVDSAPEADLLWIRKKPQEWYDKLGPLQAINHIPRERAMIRKGDLAQHLHRYGASHLVYTARISFWMTGSRPGSLKFRKALDSAIKAQGSISDGSFLDPRLRIRRARHR